MNNPLKSLLIEGTLGSRDVNFKISSEYLQLQTGIWQIAIPSVAVFHSLTEDYIFNISSDLVIGHKYQVGKLKRFEVILNQIKISKDIHKEVIVNKNPTWFIINNASCEHISIYFDEWPNTPTPEVLNDVLIAVTVNFQRLM